MRNNCSVTSAKLIQKQLRVFNLSPMKKTAFLLVVSLLFYSCERVKDKTHESISKTGETVGKGTSEFFKSVSEGVDKTFESKLELSEELKQKGLQTGKFLIERSDNGKQNLLSVYFIFDRNFDERVSVKVFDAKGQEYGRVSQRVKGAKGEAKFFDFTFEPRTNIESRSRFIFE